MVDPQQLDRLAYSVHEVAELLGLGVSSVWNLIHAGVLPTVKVGRRRLVLKRDLDALLAREDAVWLS